jgi:predicted ribosome quality control (RQC) complex YloA/Tae2 family protein
MDNFTLEALTREITPDLLQKRIHKIKQIGKTGFAFGMRGRTSESLVISLERSYPALFLTDEKVSSAGDASDWLLALRKHLTGAKILGLRKEFSERTLLIELETYRHSTLPVTMSLALELIPGKTNAFLLNHNQGVLTCHWPGSPHSEKNAGDRDSRHGFPVDRINLAEFRSWVQTRSNSGTSGAKQEANELLNLPRPKSVPVRLAGMSRYFDQELFSQHQEPDSLWERLQLLLKRVREGPYLATIYFLNKSSGARAHWTESSKGGGTTRLFVSPFPLDSLRGIERAEFLSLNAAVAKAYQILASSAPFQASQNSQLTRMTATLSKKTRLLSNLQEDLKKTERVEIYKKYADLLYAHHDKSPPGRKGVRLADLFDPEQRPIEVPLDPKLSLIQNALHYGKLYQKARRSIPVITARIKQTAQEIGALADQKQRLIDATTMDGIGSVVRESGTLQMTDKKRTSGKASLTVSREKARPSRAVSDSMLRRIAKSFASSEGLTILVGKSSKDNDTLTLKIAQSEDFWLHVAEYGGSHVILRNPDRLAVPPRQSLLEAAQLAAYFSQARNASKVEVHYTQRKFVSKPKGAKPGLVRLKDYKSISVKPELLQPHPV